MALKSEPSSQPGEWPPPWEQQRDEEESFESWMNTLVPLETALVPEPLARGFGLATDSSTTSFQHTWPPASQPQSARDTLLPPLPSGGPGEAQLAGLPPPAYDLREGEQGAGGDLAQQCGSPQAQSLLPPVGPEALQGQPGGGGGPFAFGLPFGQPPNLPVLPQPPPGQQFPGLQPGQYPQFPQYQMLQFPQQQQQFGGLPGAGPPSQEQQFAAAAVAAAQQQQAQQQQAQQQQAQQQQQQQQQAAMAFAYHHQQQQAMATMAAVAAQQQGNPMAGAYANPYAQQMPYPGWGPYQYPPYYTYGQQFPGMPYPPQHLPGGPMQPPNAAALGGGKQPGLGEGPGAFMPGLLLNPGVPEGGAGSGGGGGGEGGAAAAAEPDATALKKPRLIWTAVLHRRFTEALDKCGGVDKALPKAIMKEMDVKGLTRENVASHLQKHRMRLRKEEEACVARGAAAACLGEPKAQRDQEEADGSTGPAADPGNAEGQGSADRGGGAAAPQAEASQGMVAHGVPGTGGTVSTLSDGRTGEEEPCLQRHQQAGQGAAEGEVTGGGRPRPASSRGGEGGEPGSKRWEGEG